MYSVQTKPFPTDLVSNWLKGYSVSDETVLALSSASMDNISAAAPETVSELPAEDQASTTGLKRAVMSNERLEIVASTLRVRANMKQFGHMLGVSKSGRARPSSNKFIADFAEFMNNSKHPKFDCFFVGNDAMSGWSINRIVENQGSC